MQKRSLWRLGRVERLLYSSDGEARAATVRVAASRRGFDLIERRIEKLYPMEADQDQVAELEATTVTPLPMIRKKQVSICNQNKRMMMMREKSALPLGKVTYSMMMLLPVTPPVEVAHSMAETQILMHMVTIQVTLSSKMAIIP